MSATRAAEFRSFPDYTVCRELGDGQILSLDLRGHGHDLDLIERFLHMEATEVMDDDPDEAQPRMWEIAEMWRRSVPLHGDDEGWRAYYYQGKPGPGATPVTRLEITQTPRYWCLNHRDRPGQAGIPAERVIAGAAIVTRELARGAEELDPRLTVKGPTEHRGAWQSTSAYMDAGYIYLCWDCYGAFSERERAARGAAQTGLNEAVPA